MRRRYPNHLTGYSGSDTVIVSVRLPRPIVDFIDEHLTDPLRTRSDALQDAAVVWCLLEEDENA